ncbi:hypothetical protein B0H65DRAFT_547499 [Neurospora tetraspora]|uniref:Uncharacterized protein n=1 Tax=Neurospora tetraspora TaxID=94610 RepID=A0AAE0JGX8_9PEZI|nr:hypothetical protein B0H65DRAFT_547499 [Neurospora tetraspora]
MRPSIHPLPEGQSALSGWGQLQQYAKQPPMATQSLTSNSLWPLFGPIVLSRIGAFTEHPATYPTIRTLTHAPPPPKRRGRPKGSRNKPKVQQQPSPPPERSPKEPHNNPPAPQSPYLVLWDSGTSTAMTRSIHYGARNQEAEPQQQPPQLSIAPSLARDPYKAAVGDAGKADLNQAPRGV